MRRKKAASDWARRKGRAHPSARMDGCMANTLTHQEDEGKKKKKREDRKKLARRLFTWRVCGNPTEVCLFEDNE